MDARKPIYIHTNICITQVIENSKFECTYYLEFRKSQLQNITKSSTYACHYSIISKLA